MQNEAMRSTWELYVKGWSNVDADERRGLLEKSITPSCVYISPVAQIQGRDELTSAMEQFQQDMPGATIAVDAFTGHHDHALVHWRALDNGGVTQIPGIDSVLFDSDGRLVGITVFL